MISVANNRWGMRRKDDAGARGAEKFLIDGWKSTWREQKGAARSVYRGRPWRIPAM
jgi:hypothetical protein